MPFLKCSHRNPRLTIAAKQGMMSLPGRSGGRWKVAKATFWRKVRTPKSAMPGNARDGGRTETLRSLPVTCRIGPQKQTAKAAFPCGENAGSEGEKVVQETTGAFGNRSGQATPTGSKAKQGQMD